jgi:hypothetical protein
MRQQQRHRILPAAITATGVSALQELLNIHYDISITQRASDRHSENRGGKKETYEDFII